MITIWRQLHWKTRHVRTVASLQVTIEWAKQLAGPHIKGYLLIGKEKETIHKLMGTVENEYRKWLLFIKKALFMKKWQQYGGRLEVW